MNTSHARILLLAGLAAGLSSCHDTNSSADTNFGPENVLQAPLLSEKENHQFNKTNAKLYRQAVADSLFYSRKAEAAISDSGAAAPAAEGHDATGPAHAGDTAHAGH